MKSIIIAAGYATRLYPLTEHFPKPLLKVGSSTILDRDDVIVDVLKTGSAAVLAFTYTTTSGKTLSGNCVITNYTESSNASDDATYTIDFRVTGSVTAS